jgi:carboxyl-terminal processing protease
MLNALKLAKTSHRMKSLHLLLAATLVLKLSTGRTAPSSEPDPSQIAIAVVSILEQAHYSKKRVDNSMSEKLLHNYLDDLDYNHLFLTQEDVDSFTSKWANSLDDELIFGRTQAADQMHSILKDRAEERVKYVMEILNSEIALNLDHTVQINRQKALWPTSKEDADRIWRDRIASEMIQERLNNKKADPASVIRKRYDEFIRDLRERTPKDVHKTFLTSLAKSYDPHSEYLAKDDQEQFNISMRLSLFGIGARLKSEEGYVKVEQVVPGGPASRSEKIKPGDRIVGVAQGNGEFVDCVDMRLDKVVSMIRGEKDTVVRLQIIPVGSTNASERATIELKRDEIKLKDGEAHSELIELVQADGKALKIGIIELPSFYRDFAKGNDPEAKSTTRDALLLLDRLKTEGIDGLIMDFRRDSGGSLEEAINLSGLFFGEGPVVQTKGPNGEIAVSRDVNPSVAYDGPMVVLVNRLSASASEIFAAAMQDYGRAVIVGDSKTYGKGTVQQMVELAKVMPTLANAQKAGSIKFTIQKFYRIAGGSTQLRGVESDIVLPSMSDQDEIGEAALKDPLPYDTIPPVKYDRWKGQLHLDELRNNSAARVSKNPEFGFITEDLKRIREYVLSNSISTNEAIRKEELEKDKSRNEMRDAERESMKQSGNPKAFRITLDNAKAGPLQTITFIEPKRKSKTPTTEQAASPEEQKQPDPAPESNENATSKSAPLRNDPVKEESLHILSDLIRLTGGMK